MGELMKERLFLCVVVAQSLEPRAANNVVKTLGTGMNADCCSELHWNSAQATIGYSLNAHMSLTGSKA